MVLHQAKAGKNKPALSEFETAFAAANEDYRKAMTFHILQCNMWVLNFGKRENEADFERVNGIKDILSRALCQIRTGALSDALCEANTVRSLDDSFAAGWYLMGCIDEKSYRMCAKEENDMPSMIDQFKEGSRDAFAKTQDRVQEKISERGGKAEDYRLLGCTQYRLYNYGDAVSTLLRAKEQDPAGFSRDLESLKLLGLAANKAHYFRIAFECADSLSSEGHAAYHKGDHARAIFCLHAVTRIVEINSSMLTREQEDRKSEIEGKNQKVNIAAALALWKKESITVEAHMAKDGRDTVPLAPLLIRPAK